MLPIQDGTSTVWPRHEIGKSSVKPWTRPITIAGRKFTDWSTSSGPSASEPEALDKASEGVEANARRTASIAVVLLVLLAAEGITVLRVRTLLTPHAFLGMLLIPLILLKIGTTGYRFFRYYAGSLAYRRRGPPPADTGLAQTFRRVVDDRAVRKWRRFVVRRSGTSPIPPPSPQGELRPVVWGDGGPRARSLPRYRPARSERSLLAHPRTGRWGQA